MLTALSPLDGRYAGKVKALAPILSEYGLIHQRVKVEIAWFRLFMEHPALGNVKLDQASHAFLDEVVQQFNEDEAARVKAIEATTNHDVKAVEYFLKEKFDSCPALVPYKEFLHFAATSEDINNLAYALMVKEGRDVLLNKLNDINSTLKQFAHEYAALPMLSRTHGQSATPTTLGKEFANVIARLNREMLTLKAAPVLGKFNGAVGNFNAHCVAFPEADWHVLMEKFVQGFDLEFNAYTTQIEPHDCLAEIFHALCRINVILIDLARDIWGYISLHYFTQKVVKGEVGSSTMPHKVNPIDFENAEGNLGLANALLIHLAEKLPISRFQRDLSDSTVLRNIGPAFGYSLLAYESLHKGLHKLSVNPSAIAHDLDANWQVLAEPLQTVMRRFQIENSYEKLKALTRGETFTKADYLAFVETLAIPDADKARLRELTPQSYIGLAEFLAKRI